MREHIPASPETIGNSTGLAYCKACGYLLASDARGRTKRADQSCTPIPVTLRADPPARTRDADETKEPDRG